MDGCDNALTVPRDLSAPMQTDTLLYTIRVNGSLYEATTSIRYVYTNLTSTTVYVEATCGGYAPPSLDKFEGGTWVFAWGAAVGACKGPPITIATGQSHSDSLSVVAGTPSSNIEPKFLVKDVPGIYRLVWHGVAATPGGAEIPLEQRVSNRFVLESQ
jgi:hypothetical protein